jgi:hypothetical protein
VRHLFRVASEKNHLATSPVGLRLALAASDYFLTIYYSGLNDDSTWMSQSNS